MMCNKTMKGSLLTICLLLPMVLCSIALAHPAYALSLSNDDQKKIAQIVLEQGLKDSQSSPANNCWAYSFKVLFLSSKNLPSQFIPKLDGFRVAIESEKEIEKHIQEDKRHCWIELSKMIVARDEIKVMFVKRIETQHVPNGVRYSVGETLNYSLTNVKGKWVSTLKNRSGWES